MRIKRKYVESSLREWKDKYGHIHPAARPADTAPEVSHVELEHICQTWHPNQDVIDKGVTEGFLTLGNGRLTLTTAGDRPDVVYKVLRVPGHFCCHCNARIDPCDAFGTQAKAHLEVFHEGVRSPDPQNPSGWRKDNFYACELESGAVAQSSGRRPVSRGLVDRLLGR